MKVSVVWAFPTGEADSEPSGPCFWQWAFSGVGGPSLPPVNFLIVICPFIKRLWAYYVLTLPILLCSGHTGPLLGHPHTKLIPQGPATPWALTPSYPCSCWLCSAVASPERPFLALPPATLMSHPLMPLCEASWLWRMVPVLVSLLAPLLPPEGSSVSVLFTAVLSTRDIIGAQ